MTPGWFHANWFHAGWFHDGWFTEWGSVVTDFGTLFGMGLMLRRFLRRRFGR